MGHLNNLRRDFYYFQAKSLGYRARSAFKLLEINENYNIFENASNIVDLCAAPGSWSQALRKNTNAKIVSVDLQEIEPIDGVTILKEDITTEGCLQKILSEFDGEKADLVVCDGAPDVTGFHDIDEFLQTDLLKSALSICTRILRPGCTFVTKCFVGSYTGYLLNHFMKFFESVRIVKPASSRDVSAECFFVCKGFKAYPLYDLYHIDVSSEPAKISIIETSTRSDK